MPNNKKKRKSKEKKRTSGTASAATAPTTGHFASSTARALSPSPPSVLFPPGECLHTLQRDECELPEMYKSIHGYKQILINGGDDEEFLKRPDNANELTVRFLFYMVIHSTLRNKQPANGTFSTMTWLYGVIKCGSYDAAVQALSEDADEADDMMALLDENQISFKALGEALYLMKQESYHGMLYVLNELSPCGCLQAELERANQEAADQGQRVGFRYCFNPSCQEKKQGSNSDAARSYRYCSGCKMAQYCSSHCYHVHWRGTVAASGISHKITCNAIQEFVAFLGGGGGGREACGGDDSC